LNEILADTDVVSYLLNRHSLSQAYERLLFGYAPMISFVAVAEMYRGAYKKNWGPRRMAELATDRHYGRVHRRLCPLVKHPPPYQ
jgi:predicted nucleic acid-binding protein